MNLEFTFVNYKRSILYFMEKYTDLFYCKGFHKEHPITNIEASLIFIAHSKQFQACRQVLSICILSAHRSTHVLISRCGSMATDLEIICLSSRQELMADITNRKECFFSTAFKMHAKHIQNAVCLKKNHELSCMCFKYVR